MRGWLAALALLAGPAGAECVSARLVDPTDRYAHCVLGDCIEHQAMEVTVRASGAWITGRVDLPPDHVFEDVAARCVTHAGETLVVVVETSLAEGASLAVYTALDDGNIVKRAETPHIGMPNRWLAPAGIADLDGDGALEIAFVDRPHLARILRVVRLEGTRLVEIAERDGLTNHRIGAREIEGGLWDCGDGPEIVLSDADWRRTVAVRLADGELLARDIGPSPETGGVAIPAGCARAG